MAPNSRRRRQYFLIEVEPLEKKKSLSELLNVYLQGGYRYYYYKNERRTHTIPALIDNKSIIGAGNKHVLVTTDGLESLRQRFKKLKVKLNKKEVFYK